MTLNTQEADWMAEAERLLNEYVGAQVAYTLQPEMSLLREAGEARCALLHHASMRPAEGWMPIESCPEDTNVLVATTGGWVDTAFWTDEDGEGRKWWWLISANKYEPPPIHPNLVPTHWMPLPKHPAAPGAAPSLPEDQPSGRTYKDVDELFSAMGIPPSSGGSDEQIARRLVAWDDSGNTQGEHHETLREIINSARAALQAPSPEAGESEPLTWHELKTDPAVFDAVADGSKTFEIRRDDRNFQVGHGLLLRRTKYTGSEMRDGLPLIYTGQRVRRVITHILQGPVYGLAEGWVILSIAALPVHPQPKPSEADAKAWGLTLLNRAQAQVEASEQACADAFDNTFHKIKAEVSRDWWNRIWQMACEWQRHYTIRNKTTAQPQPSADRQEGNQQ